MQTFFVKLFLVVLVVNLWALVSCSADTFRGISKANPTVSPQAGDPLQSTTLALSPKCAAGGLILKKGQSVEVQFGASADSGTVSFSLASQSGASNVGSFSVAPDSTALVPSVVYQAPAAIPSQDTINVSAKFSSGLGTQVSCQVSLVPDTNIGTIDNGKIHAPVGNVYLMPVGTYVPPTQAALALLTPDATITVPNFSFPAQSFQSPFPGAGFVGVVSWYVVNFKTQLLVPTAGSYLFYVCSDDSSITYLDGSVLVDLSDHHAATGVPCRTSTAVQLTAGVHDMIVEYLQDQGPTFRLEESWQKADANGQFSGIYSYIPPENFDRPTK